MAFLVQTLGLARFFGRKCLEVSASQGLLDQVPWIGSPRYYRHHVSISGACPISTEPTTSRFAGPQRANDLQRYRIDHGRRAVRLKQNVAA